MALTRRLSDAPQDTVIWERFRNGDEEAFGQLYKRYFKDMARFGLKLSRDRRLVEDAIQDVFTDLWRRRTYLSEVDQPKFYLFRALRNQLLRNSRHDIFEESEDIDDFLDYLGALSAEQETIEAETVTARVERIKGAVSRLTPRQQEIIALRFYHGFSLEEVSSMMGLSRQAASNLLYRSYSVLRILMDPYAILALACFF